MNNLEQAELKTQVKKICGKDWISLSIDNFFLDEDIRLKKSSIKCQLDFSSKKASVILEGTGKGAVDALFTCLVEKLSEEYCSLNEIKFKEFNVKANISSKLKIGSDAPVKVILCVTNSRGEDLDFCCDAFSITAASIGAVLMAVELFINAQTAIIKIHAALKDAEKRSRQDLITNFTAQMATLVKVTCYFQVVQKLKLK